ncbi:TPA: DUF1203 domain-containing protein [Stenotrophomonas maltophilia]|uniref:DUF1203 domain-containing protein n=1 Tax=Stenotrophomonas maltophilia TaxID=40324 RepID=A0AAJ2JC57_STEMA|nr:MULTISPECIES: DUF1203 domain-containing protein [Stenotrophomonas]MDQ7280315.1 DUF1203 domain-containing protein [Stenotrophomonas sp. Sm6012]MDT3467483.1 DUF1203 domain-containing protein [Stenotrophomonas maltophilia]HEL3180384.1 DUF1203 domain-containing protein [Stenotrophomonas maltophilia]
MHAWYLGGLDHRPFQHLFEKNDTALATLGIQRRWAGDGGGHPCRISLSDPPSGSELLLLSHVHLPLHSPYHASGPIFVQRGVTRCVLPPGVVPSYVQRRMISVRAYDRSALMLGARVCAGSEVAAQLDVLFANAAVAFVQLHNAAHGCFSCQADRVDAQAA